MSKPKPRETDVCFPEMQTLSTGFLPNSNERNDCYITVLLSAQVVSDPAQAMQRWLVLGVALLTLAHESRAR